MTVEELRNFLNENDIENDVEVVVYDESYPGYYFYMEDVQFIKSAAKKNRFVIFTGQDKIDE